MRFGITCTKIDEVGFITHAENLGYDVAWISDSPLIRSNPWAVMALAAERTRRITLGTALVIPAMRLAPVTANGIATINRLAPGRVTCGVGTGNTAMRSLGQRPVRLAEMATYVRVLRGLLAGEEVDYTLEGATHRIGFQNTELGYVNVDDPVPIQIGGFGPRAQALAGELGDALITGIPRGGTITEARTNLAVGASRAGRDPDDVEVIALVNPLLLEPGEDLTSERVIAECGSMIMANVHYLVDLHRETGSEPPSYVLPIWEEYLDFHRRREAETAHLAMHQSHYAYLDPDEVRFVTPEIIGNFCIAGHPSEVVDQLQALAAEGLDEINMILPLERQYRMAEDFAARVIDAMG
jgi:alkanesulfonate monooxygenase SsuD/methylene tetrahydromethanopterin reductase-like flavin-dependent oxidoreductase (luciferase family)